MWTIFISFENVPNCIDGSFLTNIVPSVEGVFCRLACKDEVANALTTYQGEYCICNATYLISAAIY